MADQSVLVDIVFQRLFGSHPEADALRKQLDTVSDPPSPRVQLAVLKLSRGDPEKLQAEINTARLDYRDVLAYAEYPGEMRTHPSKRGLKPGELAEIRRRDREQYLSWLASFD